MRNVWKGLTVGALTGALVGVALDLAGRAEGGVRELAGATGRAVREHGPDAMAAVTEAAGRAGRAVKEADLPGKAQAVAHDVAEKAADSSAGRVIREHTG